METPASPSALLFRCFPSSTKSSGPQCGLNQLPSQNPIWMKRICRREFRRSWAPNFADLRKNGWLEPQFVEEKMCIWMKIGRKISGFYRTKEESQYICKSVFLRNWLSECIFKWKEEGLKPLEWTSRLKIALDVARGVEYLHILAQQSYIHRDIKSPNILLGDDMRAKLADFGFVCRAADRSVSVETRVVGSFGYLAPEYAESGRVTRKADVYSFGVVLMELITGRKAVGETIDEETFHLVTWFRKMLTQKGKFREAIDQSIEVDKDTLASIRTVAKLAGRCSAKERDRRPRMSHVVNVLSSLAECWKPPVLNSDATHVPDFGMSLPEALENWRVVEGESIADITDAYDPCFNNGVTHAAASVANLNEDLLVEMVARSDLKDVLKACGQAVAEGDSPTAAGLYVKRTVQ